MQHRLAALGFTADAAEHPGHYGEGTAAAVAAFQERRGLRADGVCGDYTWQALVEAGYRLGDRPLYLGDPMLRGDDVFALQSHLGALGFDAGRVDGIFGARTDRALLDFQRNAGLVTDAICGPATVTALARLGTSCEAPYSSASVREREQFRRGPASLAGRLIAVGESGGLDALARSVTAAISTAGGRILLLQHPDGSEQAMRANTAGADAYIGLALGSWYAGDTDAAATCTTAYYRAPTGWESPEGLRLAALVQVALPGLLGAKDGGIRGMAVPVLRETRMPAVLADLGPAEAVVERAGELAIALTGALRAWVALPDSLTE